MAGNPLVKGTEASRKTAYVLTMLTDVCVALCRSKL
jgi:hypothetical protein